jgi:hypothetical protein
MNDIYCVKCKAKTPTTDAKEVVAKNGRPMIKGKCSKCGTTKCRFI